MRELLWATVHLSLAVACVMDLRSCRVYNIVWWISGAAAVWLYPVIHYCPGREQLGGLLLFLLLQYVVFSRWYGRADCHAFGMCAIAGGSCGFTLLDYLLQMLLAFIFLGAMQGLRGNINKKGNLKEPVPFLPYITLAFWGMLWYHSSC